MGYPAVYEIGSIFRSRIEMKLGSRKNMFSKKNIRKVSLNFQSTRVFVHEGYFCVRYKCSSCKLKICTVGQLVGYFKHHTFFSTSCYSITYIIRN